MNFSKPASLMLLALSAGLSSAAVPAQASASLANLNTAYSAKISRLTEGGRGFQLRYSIAGRAVTRKISLPSELWDRIKGGFHPHLADIVVTPAGEVSSVAIRAGRRELWITMDRATGGKCLAMIYPSGGDFREIPIQPGLACGVVEAAIGSSPRVSSHD